MMAASPLSARSSGEGAPLLAAEPFFPTLGNGRFFLRFSGDDISGFRAEVASPSLFSLKRLTPSDPSDLARSVWEHGFLHTLSFSSDPAHRLRICDTLHPTCPLFARTFTCSSPITLSLSVPSYVARCFLPQYPFRKRPLDCLRLSLLPGVPLADGFFAKRAITLFLFVTGNAVLHEDRITLFPGESTLYVTGNDPAEATALTEALLAQTVLLPSPREVFSVVEPTGVKHVLLKTLLAHLAPSGGAARDFDHPYAFSDDLPFWIAALCRCGERARARKLLTFYERRYRECQGFASAFALDAAEALPSEHSSLCGLPLAAGALLYWEYDPDPTFFSGLYSMLAAALTEVLPLLIKGTLPFSGASPLFEDEPLRVRHLFDGALPTTLLFVDTAERFLALSQALEKPLSPLRALKRALEDVKQRFPDNFFSNGRFYLNAPSRAHSLRRPRFAYLVCLGCYREAPYLAKGLWEKNENGVYLCPTCMSKRPHTALSPEPSPRFGENEAFLCLALSRFGRQYLDAESRLSVPDSTDTSRGLFLAAALAAERRQGKTDAFWQRALQTLTCRSALLPVFYCGDRALLTTPDPAAIALLLATNTYREPSEADGSDS